MRPVARIGLAAVGVAMLLALTLPLALVTRATGVLPEALSADEAAGTPWRGVLRGARWNGQHLGDVRVGLQALPLLLGRVRVHVATPAWTTQLETGARRGLASAEGRLDLPLRFLPGAMASIEARKATLVFSDGICAHAGGQVEATVRLGLADVPDLQLSGQPACEGTFGLLLLDSAPGAAVDVQMLWSILNDGSYQARTRVRTEDPAARLALQLAGFEATPEGLVRSDAGHASKGSPP